MRAPPPPRPHAARLALCAAALLAACGGYAEGLAGARRALLEGRARDADAALTAALDDGDARDRPLLLLERAVARQRAGEHAAAARDLMEADERLEVLDYTHATAQEVSRYLFSDDAAPYRAQPFEKLLVNALAAASSLAAERRDAAKVEARRLRVYRAFAEERRAASPSFAAALDALGPLCDLVAAAALPGGVGAGVPDGRAELLVLTSGGLVPHKRGARVPLGAAVVYMSSQGDLTEEERHRARALYARGAVKWLNFVELVHPAPAPPPRPLWAHPAGGEPLSAAPATSVHLDDLARRSFELARPKIFTSALTRLLTRAAVGGVSREVTGRAAGGLAGLLVGLAAEGALSAADTPDTRGWTSLPARLDAYWLRLPPGEVELAWGGATRRLSLRAGVVHAALFP